LNEIGWGGRASYKVSSLWPAGESKTCTGLELEKFACTVKHDKTAAGGLRVFKIEL